MGSLLLSVALSLVAAQAPVRTPTVTVKYYPSSCTKKKDSALFDAQWQKLLLEWRAIKRWYWDVSIGNKAGNPKVVGKFPTFRSTWHQVHLCNYSQNRPLRLHVSGHGWSASSASLAKGERVVITIEAPFEFEATAEWSTTAMWFQDVAFRGGWIAKG